MGKASRLLVLTRRVYEVLLECLDTFSGIVAQVVEGLLQAVLLELFCVMSDPRVEAICLLFGCGFPCRFLGQRTLVRRRRRAFLI